MPTKKTPANIDTISTNKPNFRSLETLKDPAAFDAVDLKSAGAEIAKMTTKKKSASDPEPKAEPRVLTPEEAAQLGEGTRIDYKKEIEEQRAAHIDHLVATKDDATVDMLENALEAEASRNARHDEALNSNPDLKAELVSGNPATTKVVYKKPLAEDGIVERTSLSERHTVESDAELEDDALTPGYDFTDDATPPEATSDEQQNQRPNYKSGTEREYVEYIKGLEVTAVEPKEESIIQIVKEKTVISTVDSGRKSNMKIVGDQAFLNSVNKYKRDNFRMVSVPLVNSGFTVDVVGTGAVDLMLLYNTVDENTAQADYELEKMKTIFRNIVGVHPAIDKNQLKNMIHFADYSLLAYAHIAATLEDIEMIQTCEKCGRDFHITCKSTDLIINMNELHTKMEAIKSADTIDENSLMTSDRQMTFDSGFTVNLGHPSYSEYVQYLTELKNLASQLPKIQAERISNLAQILPFVRSVCMPNNVRTNNLFQRFTAITLLPDNEYQELQNEIAKLRKMILTPKFGIKTVKCPHCHEENTDIEYSDLTNLLFFHTMVSRLLNQTENS